MMEYVKLVEETNTQLNENMTFGEVIKKLEQLAGGIDIKVTKHFVDRIHQRDVDPQLAINALKEFIEKYSTKLANNKKKEIGGVLMYIAKHLNIPLSYQNNGTPSPKDDTLSLLTIMQKKGFVPNNKEDKIFEV